MLKRAMVRIIVYLTAFAFGVCAILLYNRQEMYALTSSEYIKWVDMTVTAEAMRDTLEADILLHESNTPARMSELLALLSAKYCGEYKGYSKKDVDTLVKRIKAGESADEIGASYKYYSYYKEAYSAVFDGFTGEYYSNGKLKYGLTVFSPIASGFYFSHCDDFGVSRSYGYKRKHLGHDLMGSVGTPIIAIESGYVEALGWNQYGGWRVGIRSFDNKRYYYYAHLKKDHPFADGLSVGDTVNAGDVIGYMGMTGYSVKENVNNIKTPHLHMGIQLIFDPLQKDGYNQIWLDCYEIVKFLMINKMPVIRSTNGRDHVSAIDFELYSSPDH